MPILTKPKTIRYAVLGFFGLQVVAIVAGIFLDEKHFNWVPYDELSNYEIEVAIADTSLSEKSIYQRYKRPARHRENRSIHNLIALVRRYETTYGRDDHATIIINYRTNGQSSSYWSWPEDYIRTRDTTSTQR